MTALDVHRTAPPAPPVGDVVAEVEAERAALAGLLHDAVAQTLFAARYAADRAGAPDVVEAVRDAIREVTDAMWRLKPRTESGDLDQALHELARRHSDRVVVVRTDGVPRLSPAAATVAFRVVQAAVDACEANTIDVRAEVRSGVLTVSVSDDGPPYDSAVYTPDSELARWLGRACRLGGYARVGDGMNGGTTLWLEIPNALPEGDDTP